MKKMKLPNGYGTISKLSGNRRKPYMARASATYDVIDEHGSLKADRPIIGYYAKYTEAFAAIVKYNENPYDLNSKKLTLDDIYKKWCKTPYYIDLSDSAKKSHSIAFKKLSAIHDKPFCDINTFILQDVVDSVTDRPSVKMQIKKLMSNLYKYTEKHDITTKNYAKYIETGDTTSKIKRRIYTSEEVGFIWSNIDSIKWVDSILFMLYTGFRVGEMLSIKNEDVDLDKLTISGGSKTDAGIRTIPIHSKIIDIVKNRYDPSRTYLFGSLKDKKMSADSYRSTYYSPIMEQLGLTGSGCHDTRHTFCSKMDSYNINKTTLKALMGHSTKDVTDIYTHKDIETLKAAIELLVY